jgi:hypothetical protein
MLGGKTKFIFAPFNYYMVEFIRNSQLHLDRSLARPAPSEIAEAECSKFPHGHDRIKLDPNREA